MRKTLISSKERQKMESTYHFTVLHHLPLPSRERVAYILVDESSQNTRKLREFIRNSNLPDVSLHSLQINLLASINPTVSSHYLIFKDILSTALNCEPESLTLEGLTKDDAAKFYEAAVQILNEAVLMYAYTCRSLTLHFLGTKMMLKPTA